ncbi:uncharacterized protein LOC128957215 [Oppia nitens]|uniref:uncharacterized protein LOC128957214 n=1 Tax=Oppia nitens TaxID=1686743 RepID=UPI0023DA021A|nr:uncharacterized protein LOC128957214 [Oppia nitens]XP_054158921.1 uncharacterized protein LOC128957215 [Oppia nitens]
MPITRLDNQRVIVSISDDLEEWGWDCASSRLPVAVAGESRGGVGAGTPQLQRPPPLPPIRVLSDSLLEKSMDDDNDDDNDGDDCSSNHNNNADEKENLPVLMLTPAPLPQQALPNTPADSSRQMITAAAANNPSVTANISFSDDTKSEQFFRDLLLAAQHMPVQSPLKSSAKCQVPNIAAAPNHRLSSVNTKCLNSNNYGNTAIDPNNIAESMATSCESPSVTYSRHQTATADRPLPLPPPHIINDIDLDATLRSIQLYHNLRQNSDKTHSHSQQMTGSSPIDCRLNTSVPNFTPPQPPVRTTIMPAAMTKHYKPISGGGGLQLAPPLPPKPSDIVRGERGPPPPRPPSSRQSIYTVVANNGGVGTAAAPANNMSTLIKNLDKTIESNVIFV